LSTQPILTVVMPVYNEEEIIEETLDVWVTELKRVGIDFKCQVYNDGSKDNTLEVIKKYAQTCPQVEFKNKENSGHGPTILNGYRENNDSEWIFQVDSDNELSPEFFETLWKNRENYDLLVGRRTARNSDIGRKIITFISRITVNVFCSRGVYDVNVPYRLMRSAVFKEYFEDIPLNTCAPNILLSGIASFKKIRIFETPISHKERSTGSVSIKAFKLLKFSVKSFLQTIIFFLKLHIYEAGKK